MKFRTRALALLLTLLLIVPLMFSCQSEEPQVLESSSEISKTQSEDQSELSNENSTEISLPESSIEDESVIPEDTVISFLACPDNLIHPSLMYDAINRACEKSGKEPDYYSDLHNAEYDFAPIYDNVKEQIAAADIAYINQESLIGGDSRKISGYPCFNTPLAMGETVIELGFDVVNAAHNHMLDSGNTDFLEHCNTFFESSGVDLLGYYPNEDAVDDITIIEKDGVKIAFLTYTYGTNGIRLPSGSDFIIPYFEDELIEQQVAVAKQEADFIIVSCHWGNENTYDTIDMQEHYAEFLCELGVDVVLGMHPHNIQPIEWMTSEAGKKTLVVYSLGNFVSGMQKAMNVFAGMLSLNIVKDGETGEIYIDSPLFIPIVNHYVKERSVAGNDTGYRNFTIYYLEDYTEELAAEHGVVWFEKSNRDTLVGGGFSLENLYNTLYEYISPEFLDEKFVKNESNEETSSESVSE